ncbi:MAG: hypothetical protein QNJ55_03055 [Xenococcus sp. MO_188.B8]|nr:hypothetical protein [Xenococcus sp. MO_188.B8]
MHLEPLCNLELAYREESLYQGKFVMARPYDSQEASAYGEGDGWVKGERLQGTARWVNHPHCRTDGVWLPNLHGVIQTEDGASILFSLQGRTKFRPGGQGNQILTAILQTGDERYEWVNDSICILEGVIEGFAMRAQIFQCINELV